MLEALNVVLLLFFCPAIYLNSMMYSYFCVHVDSKINVADINTKTSISSVHTPRMKACFLAVVSTRSDSEVRGSVRVTLNSLPITIRNSLKKQKPCTKV